MCVCVCVYVCMCVRASVIRMLGYYKDTNVQLIKIYMLMSQFVFKHVLFSGLNLV